MELAELTAEMHRFVDEKGWYDAGSPKPQSPHNLATSLAIEAAEVLEFFQWTDDLPVKEDLASELADVLLYLLQLASVSGIDLEHAALSKLNENYERSW
jgi:NTP pyrophosphatase (non-canonical NTP hydrolase)